MLQSCNFKRIMLGSAKPFRNQMKKISSYKFWRNKQSQNNNGQKTPQPRKSEQQVSNLKQELEFKEREINQLKQQISNYGLGTLKQSVQQSPKANVRPQSGVPKKQIQQNYSQETKDALKQIEFIKEDYQVKLSENQELKKQLQEIMEYLKSNGLIDDNASRNQSRVSEGQQEEIKEYEEDFENSELMQQQKLNQSDNHIEEQVEDDEYDENPFQKELEEMRLKKKQMEENRRLQKEREKMVKHQVRDDQQLSYDNDQQQQNQYGYDEFERDDGEQGSLYNQHDITPNSV